MTGRMPLIERTGAIICTMCWNAWTCSVTLSVGSKYCTIAPQLIMLTNSLASPAFDISWGMRLGCPPPSPTWSHINNIIISELQSWKGSYGPRSPPALVKEAWRGIEFPTSGSAARYPNHYPAFQLCSMTDQQDVNIEIKVTTPKCLLAVSTTHTLPNTDLICLSRWLQKPKGTLVCTHSSRHSHEHRDSYIPMAEFRPPCWMNCWPNELLNLDNEGLDASLQKCILEDIKNSSLDLWLQFIEEKITLCPNWTQDRF